MAGDCVNEDLRLVGSLRETEAEGKVEMCIEREWFTVCVDEWTNNSTEVVCRQLGFSPDGEVLYL